MEPEVTKDSDLTAFEAFFAKLELEIPKWEELLQKDTADKEASEDTAELYEKRIKADNMAIKAITDFKTFLQDTIIQPWKDADQPF